MPSNIIDLRPALKRHRVTETTPSTPGLPTETAFWIPPQPSPLGEKTTGMFFIPPPSPGPVKKTPEAPRSFFIPPSSPTVLVGAQGTYRKGSMEFFVPPLSPTPLPFQHDGESSKRLFFIPPKSPVLSAHGQSDTAIASKLRSTSEAMTGLSLVDKEIEPIDHGGRLLLNIFHFK
jgi:hypothetical protein